ncbi:YeaC family protein [Larsenimonas suaedae]|uniref:DUF1315 family protein n=1 Tax=Larsenimonas suaedae TaxID=1851019 RepID=A0ABU1GXI6_9GAMM|nr:DUF1315 family protein [Larsenimonas suaedae]MCM2971511.1 YeaC family protein [Larsenimonas suaedae]MDR5896767.1 DUF1315 family protein [Larsenimonas suaedae]
MSDMTFDKIAAQLTPELYQRFKSAIELGKWPDGTRLSKDQVALCMEAVIHYEHTHDIPEASRIGYIDRSNKKKSDDDNITWVN